MKSFLCREIILILVAASLGCAFKEPVLQPAAPAQEAPKSQPIETPKPRVDAKKRGIISIGGESKTSRVTFSEYKREYEVSEHLNNITITKPISLPERIPQEFPLKIASSSWKNKSLEKVMVRAKPALENAVGT